MHACIQYIHTHMRTYINTHMRVCVHAYTHMLAYMCIHVHVCINVRRHERACTNVFMHVYIYVCIHGVVYSCMYVCMHACMLFANIDVEWGCSVPVHNLIPAGPGRTRSAPRALGRARVCPALRGASLQRSQTCRASPLRGLA